VAVAIGVVVYQLRSRPKDLVMLLGLGLLLGGALGNLIDRVTLGYVRDMIDLRWNGHNIWPIFNLADIAVCTATTLMVIYSFRAGSRSQIDAS
jgi:signal peptidase II